MPLSSIPGTLPTGTYRRLPWRDDSRTMRVPLWTTNAEGEELTGLIKVPVALVGAPLHTNQRLKFEAFLAEQLGRWIEWRARRGWMLNTRPKVTGPFDPLTDGQHDSEKQMARAMAVLGKSGSVQPVIEEPEEVKWYWATARFKRVDPVYARLEDILFLKELASKNEIDPDQDAHPWNDVDEGPDEIAVDGGIDIMADAERRRQEQGKKRSDYLIGKLEDPL